MFSVYLHHSLSPFDAMLRIKSGFSGERSLVLPKMVTDMMAADAIVSVLYVTDIGYYPKAENHYRERLEPIDQYVFIYCIDGRGRYEVGGNSYEVAANQYFILPAGVPHRYQADAEEPWTIYWIHFKGVLAPHYAADAIAPHVGESRHTLAHQQPHKHVRGAV